MLRLSERTLERMRVTGDGPPFVKTGRRVAYRSADIDAWIASRTRQSTSQNGEYIRCRVTGGCCWPSCCPYASTEEEGE